ncbi:MAG: alpha/beta hydrolase [Muribaculaceae bacterium]|nr:alpha/beta hydrolase [bacterium]MCM1494039.1 alpha/beta hydrolase [Muribaculaceae bacterium]
MKKKGFKIVKAIGLGIAAVIILLFAVRAVGVGINRRTPKGGINESLYVEINGTKQWISIYGDSLSNPVLLYLHGGPGSPTSEFDYVITRKWADVYTVVTWDQRNCGKSYDAGQNEIELTRDLLLEDGKEMTEFILDYLSADQITILGHSWGSIYGANLVLEYPEYYECFIGTGQLVDSIDNETAFQEVARSWVEGDDEGLALVAQLTPESMTMDHILAKNALMEKYGYGLMKDGSDYNLITTIIFNPNYSLADWVNYFSRDMGVYLTFFQSEEFRAFSLKGRLDYKVPYYNINGNMDYQTNYKLAEEYFDSINAPYKKLFIMENTTHGLLESKSEEFSEIVHTIAKER